MRVAVVIGELNTRAGPSTNGLRLALALQEAGHCVDILHRSRPDTIDSGGGITKCMSHLLPACHPLNPMLGLAFLRLALKRKWHVVIFLVPTHASVLSPSARLAGCRTVFQMGTNWSYNAKWIRGILRLACGHTIDHLVGVSSSVLDDLRRHRVRCPQMSVIYNAVSTQAPEELRRWACEVRKELDIGSEELVIGTCGRLVSWKRPMRMMEACNELVARGRDFRFIVVGDGPERGPMEAYCRERGIDDRMRFVGWQSNVFRYLAAMDVFVFHSPDEGLPTVVAEAAMIGLPLVLPDLPSLREVFSERTEALFAAADDVAAYVDHMDALINDVTLRTRLADQVQCRAIQSFSMESMRRRYDDLIRRLVNPREVAGTPPP